MLSTEPTLRQLSSIVHKRLGIDSMLRNGDTLMVTGSDLNVNLTTLADLANSMGCSSVAVVRPDGALQSCVIVADILRMVENVLA